MPDILTVNTNAIDKSRSKRNESCNNIYASTIMEAVSNFNSK